MPSVPLAYRIGVRANTGLLHPLWKVWKVADLLTPIDFVRYREFAFAFEAIRAHHLSRATILDISSPKLLPLTLAYAWRDSMVVSTDIVSAEVEWVTQKGASLGLSNLRGERADARALPYDDNTFDVVSSVSVFEHVAPEMGGDLPAVQEAARVLRPGGVLVLTVPFSRHYFAEYVAGPVYERSQSAAGERLFFQRFYDMPLLERTFVEGSGLTLKTLGFIHERFASPDPKRRVAHRVNATRLQKLLFGPSYPLLSQLFLSAPRPLTSQGKPYIACLVLKKES